MKQLTQQQLEQVYRENPEWAMEVGKWYRLKGTKLMMCFQGKTGNNTGAYGFNLLGEWYNNIGIQEGDQWTPASDAEVAEALIAEARKRGFKAGVEINYAALGFHDGWQKIEHRQIDGDIFSWKGGHLNLGSRCTSIFHDGNWADVREAAATVEVGKWYKAILPMSGSLLFFSKKIVTSAEVGGYGFGFSGKWYDEEESGNFHHGGLAVEATNEEVEAALIAEAKRRYRDGDKLSTVIDDCSLGKRIFSQNLYYQKSDWSLWVLNDGGTNYDSCIFSDGKWATVVTPASALAEDIQALRDKYPDYNWTIIAEGK